MTKRRVASIGVLAAGTVLLILALGQLSWYHQSSNRDAAPDTHFDDFINTLGGRDASALVDAYFPTLAWVLLAAAVVAVVVANLRTALTAPARIAGVVIGLAAVVLTYLALAQLFHVTYNPAATNSERGVFLGSRPGLWCALVGYLLCAVAAAIAPPARGRPSDTIEA
jgi:hypothetical protein